MLPATDSGDMPMKMGRRVGRQAQTTAMQVPGTAQYIRVASSSAGWGLVGG